MTLLEKIVARFRAASRPALASRLLVACLVVGCALLVAPLVAGPDSAASGRSWLERGDASGFESTLAAEPDAVAELFSGVAEEFTARPEGRPKIGAFLDQVFRLHVERLAAEGPPRWRADEPRLLLAISLLDPPRYVADATFRELVATSSPLSRMRPLPAPLRDGVIEELGGLPGASFDLVEMLALGAGSAPRSSRGREVAYANSLGRCAESGAGPIEASVFVLPSEMFYRAEAARFLEAVAALDPEREVVVVTDAAMQRSLAANPALARVRFVASWERHYSPWPRDPLLFCRRPDGGIVLLTRPNLQPGREADADLARALVQGLPDDLDRAWGGVRWSRAPVPFHNGQVLFANGDAWMSIHTVEPLDLERLGLDRVPVAEFSSAAGIARYTQATTASALELGRFYGASPQFVHPLPSGGSLDERVGLMRALSGGAGFDLDSLLTLLPADDGAKPAALLGDIGFGSRLVESAPANDLESLRDAYGFLPATAALRDALVSAQKNRRAQALAAFLDRVAAHLEQLGLRVSRLPLLLVPTSLVRNGDQTPAPDFLLTWSNVVVERQRGALRAEGFASGLAPGDAAATAAFRRAGCELRLLPPLVRSIILNGGYRCASNNLRRTATR